MLRIVTSRSGSKPWPWRIDRATKNVTLPPAATAGGADVGSDNNSSPRMRDRAVRLVRNVLQAVSRIAMVIMHPSAGVTWRLVVLSPCKCQADCQNQQSLTARWQQ